MLPVSLDSFLYSLHCSPVTAISMTITASQEELRRGQTVTLECQAGSSNPKANISWILGPHRFVEEGGVWIGPWQTMTKWCELIHCQNESELLMFIHLNAVICRIVLVNFNSPADWICWMGFVCQVPGIGAATQGGSVRRRFSAQFFISESEFTASQPEGHLPGPQPWAHRGDQHILQTQRSL